MFGPSFALRATEGILRETLVRRGLPSEAASEASDWRRMAERVGFVPDELTSLKSLGPIQTARARQIH
jgi:hypothetical protein